LRDLAEDLTSQRSVEKGEDESHRH
jgi:hypothetical protein